MTYRRFMKPCRLKIVRQDDSAGEIISEDGIDASEEKT